MMREIWSDLQNGTDIRGIAIKAPGKTVNLTSEKAKYIAIGFVHWISKTSKKEIGQLKIAVGMDSRLSGPEIKAAFIEGVKSQGCTIYDCHMATTPAMFMSTVMDAYQCDGSVMITASHLPYYYNGLKFFTKDGGCEKEDIKAILELASKTEVGQKTEKAVVKSVNLIGDYANLLVNIIRKGVNSKTNYDRPLTGCKIIVDAGNGAGGFFAAQVLEKLGANTEGSQFLDPDGNFPNHVPNPENNEAIESIKKAVLDTKADLGIIFDTDVDRAAVVSSDGVEVNKNALIALISSIILEEHPKSTIVTDSVTSIGLAEFIDSLGGIHHRFKRGYKNVINESKRLNQEGIASYLAIETSGHAALKENYFLDDGAYLIAKILIKMALLNEAGKSIQSLITKLKTPVESLDFRIGIKKTEFKPYGFMVLDELATFVTKVEGWSLVPNNYEGVRVNVGENCGDGWFLLRMSLHEPVLALNVESDVAGGIQMIVNKLSEFLEQYKELDIDSINKIG